VTTVDRCGIYGWAHHVGGVAHFRITEPLRAFGGVSDGIRVAHGLDLTHETLDTYDTILAHGVHDPERTHIWHELAAFGKHRLVLDVDDAVWAPDFAPMRDHYLSDGNLQRLYDNVTVAHVVTTPSPVIADHLSRWNRNVHVVPNTVPAWLLEHTPPARDLPTVGFQGSDSHIGDWTSSQKRHLQRFLGEHPDWALHTYGGHRVESDSDRIRHTGWCPDVETYWRSVSMDVGIGPLRDSPFNRAKSDLRAREYAALGIVAVLPDLPLYRGTVDDGVTGRLIQSHQTLSGVLREVCKDVDALRHMQARARRHAQAFTTEANIERWVTAWTSV